MELLGVLAKNKERGFFTLFLLFIFIFFFFSPYINPDEIIVSKDVIVKGLTLSISPVTQNVPVNTGTSVNTVLSIDDSGSLKGIVVKGELSGPGLSKAITLTTLPNYPFSIPGLTVKGKYYLDNIRLERNGEVVSKSDPERAEIEVIDLIITSIKTRPLTMKEIREKGIVITDNNFKIYNLSIAFKIKSDIVNYSVPIVYSNNDLPPRLLEKYSAFGIPGTGRKKGIKKSFKVFSIKVDGPTKEKEEGDKKFGLGERKVQALLVFNNNIAFLHQYFSVMFIITNSAPDGSNLSLKDITATLTLPDGLREAETNPPHITGTPVPVKCPGPDGKIGTADDITVILATFSGMSEFIAEGLKKGSHVLKVDFKGTLSGLPSGDVTVSGSAKGMVIVRDPEFSIVFAHPSVIRSGEEYDILVTITNTSPVPANLVSFTMPASRLIGTRLLSDETLSFETIESGKSETLKFHMLSLETGGIRASAIAVDGPVSGKFLLTAGVGEKGIPLSPDTLSLPPDANYLPSELLTASLELLGQAYSLATTPPEGVPEGLPFIEKEIVQDRIIDIGYAGQRVRYTEPLVKSIEVLALDWLGNIKDDLSFDILRRITSKGGKFAAEVSKIFNKSLETNSLSEFQKSYAETCSYKKEFFSAAVSFGGSKRTALLSVRDYYENSLGYNGEDKVRDIPFGELFSLEDGSSNPVDFALIGLLEEHGYTVEIEGKGEGTFSLYLIVPDQNGNLRQVLFEDIPCKTGSVSSIFVKRGDLSFSLKTDLENDGTIDSAVSGTIISIVEPDMRFIHAEQDISADSVGRAVALFFNKDVSVDQIEDLNNFYIKGKAAYGAFLQPSGRVVILGLKSAISPFVENKITVSNIVPSPTEKIIVTTIKTPGGIVSGRVLSAQGDPLSGLLVQLTEFEGLDSLGFEKISNSYVTTDDNGNYMFDYVRMLRDPFELKVKDPNSGRLEAVNGKITANGQRYRVDLIMRGRGNLTGTIIYENGSPVEDATIVAKADNNGKYEYFSDKTDSNGKFLVRNVPIGPIFISAGNEKYFGVGTVSITAPGETASVTVTLYSGKTGSVSGRVFFSDSVTPVPNTYVQLDNTSEFVKYTQTDSNGYFHLLNIPVGKLSLYAVDPNTGRFTNRINISVFENKELNVNIILRGTGSVFGKVLSFDNRPLENIHVYIESTNKYVKTNSQGEFELDGVSVSDNYRIVAYDENTNKKIEKRFSIRMEGEKVNILFTFDNPNPTLGGVNGKIMEPDGVTPVMRAMVNICNEALIILGATRTDVNGNYSISGLKAGSYFVYTKYGKYAGIKNVTLKFNGHFETCNFNLRGKGKVIINLLDPTGSFPIMGDVEFNSIVFKETERIYIGFYGDRSSYTTDINGHLEFNNIFCGDFSIIASNSFYSTKVRKRGSIDSNGEEKTITIRMNESDNLNGDVKVKVLGLDNTTPVPGAKVTMKIPFFPDMVKYTDSNGEFLFSMVKPGNFVVEAENMLIDQYDNYGIISDKSGYMGHNGEHVQINIKLKGSVTLKVTVKNGDSVVPNAAVTLKSIYCPVKIHRKTTDSEGKCTFYNVVENDFTVSVLDSVTALHGGAGVKVYGPGSTKEITVLLEPSGTVRGKVFKPNSSETVPNVRIKLIRESDPSNLFSFTTSSQDGSYEFASVPVGKFSLIAYDPISGRPGKRYGEIKGEGGNYDLDITLQGRGNVSGIFYDNTMINPVSGAAIEIRNKKNYFYPINTTTDSSGKFSFEQIAKGDFIIRARDKSTGLTGSAEGKISYEGEDVVVNIFSQVSGKVKGIVFETDGVTPVPNAGIRLRRGEKNYGTVSNGEGRYELSYIPKGNFSINAYEQNGNNRGTSSGAITFNGEEAEVNIIFEGLGTISGNVKDGGGVLLSGKEVKLFYKDKLINTFMTGQNGEFNFQNINLGKFTVEVYDPVSSFSATVSGTLSTAGETKTVNLVLAEAGTVSGTVLNPNGTSHADKAYVEIKGPGYTKMTSTDSDGNFTFNYLKLGDFTLKVKGFNNSGKYRSSGSIVSHGDTVTFNDIVLDNVRPAIDSFFPANGSSNIPISTGITIIFSEKLSLSTVNGNTVKLLSASGPVRGSVTTGSDGRTITFTPSSQLKSFSLYTISLNGAIEDIAGNTLGNNYQSSFTTSDIIPPSVIGINPPNNSAGVAVNTVIKVTFSEPINSSDFNAGNISVKKGNDTVNGTLLFNETKTELSFTPTQVLIADSTYNVSITGYKDISGNTQNAVFSSVFHTPDTISPSITLVPPSSGTTVTEGTNVTVSVTLNNSPDTDKVYFFIDGVTKKTDSSLPFSYTFRAPLIADIGRTNFLVEALAIDKAGNQSTKRNMTFNLLADNPPQITLTGPSSTVVYPGNSVNFSVSATDDVLLKRVTMTGSGGLLNYSNISNISQKTFTKNYTVSIPADILPGTVLTFNAVAKDSRENSVSGGVITLHVPNDENPPTITITSPAADSSFDHKDVISITANASDDIGMKEVNFYLDDTLLNKDTQEPYTASYTVPPLDNDKNSVIRAEAVDLAGKITNSQINVVLKKLVDETAPVVTLITPSDGSLVYKGENLKIKASATDDEGVSKVEFYINGQLTDTKTAEPYETTYTVPANAVAGTSFVIMVKAVDVDSKEAEDSATVEVIDGTVIPAGTVIDENDTSYDNKTVIINSGTVTVNGSHTFTNLLVKEGGKLTTGSSTTSTLKKMELEVIGKTVIGPDASVTVSGRGYAGAGRNGNAGSYGLTLGNTTTGGSYGYSAGSYGGFGGKYGSNAVNKIYGSIYEPSDAGSGGGGSYDSNYHGGNGGGILRITAGEIFVDGSIASNGQSTTNGHGAGSGGSIWIDVGTLSGSGAISVNGGNNSSYGAGGGGRVAVYYTDASGFDLSKITAYGGKASNGSNSTLNGGAGTVYLKKSTDIYGDLIVDNNGTTTNANSTKLPSVGEGQVSLLEPNRLQGSGMTFIPSSLTGINIRFVIGQSYHGPPFKIISNTAQGIFTDPSSGDMTQYGAVGTAFKGVLNFKDVHIKGKANVYSFDILEISGTKEVESGSTLVEENQN